MKEKHIQSARSVLCIIPMILLFARPDAASDGIRRGLSVCADTLIPSIFPFMVISEILVRSGQGAACARYFGRPMQRIFGISGAGAGAFLMGILCGFPVGAKTAISLYKHGNISKSDAEALMTFCNFPSAPFMIFAVGEGLFGNKKLGILIYLSVLISGLICSTVGRCFRKKDISTRAAEEDIKSGTMTVIFTESVTSAAFAVISVCAYVVFFTCAVSCLSSLFGGSGELFRALIFSFFELTSGAAACAALGNGTRAVMLCSAAAGWSGLSVFFQISSLSQGISMRPYLISKAFSAPLSALISALSLRFMPKLIPLSPTVTDAFLSFKLYPGAFIHAGDLIFILSLLFYLLKRLDRSASI